MKTTKAKERLFLILKILIRYTDSEHFLSSQKLMTILETEYGLTIDRKTIVYDIKALREVGVKIIASQKRGYSIDETPFRKSEIKLLFDLINSFRNISSDESQALIAKLSGFLSIYDEKSLKEMELTVSKNATKTLFYLEIILRVIEKGETLKVTIKDKEDEIIPYLLYLNNGYYYLYYSYLANHKIYHVRIDNIKKVDYTLRKHKTPMRFEECRKLISESTDAYTGEDLRDIKLKILAQNSYVLDDILANFSNALVKGDCVYLKVRLSDVFFAKIAIYKDRVKIVGPKDVATAYKEFLMAILARY